MCRDERGIFALSLAKEIGVRFILIDHNAVETSQNHRVIVCLLDNAWDVQESGIHKMIKKNKALCLFCSQESPKVTYGDIFFGA